MARKLIITGEGYNSTNSCDVLWSYLGYLPCCKQRTFPPKFEDDLLLQVFARFCLSRNTTFFHCFGSSKEELLLCLKIRICDPCPHQKLSAPQRRGYPLRC